MNPRIEILKQNYPIEPKTWLDSLKASGQLIYNSCTTYIAGTDFLASNEFDFHKASRKYYQADVVAGFGTNALWDLALVTKAHRIIISDWSPWPILAHSFIFSPLFRMASTPQEFVMMVSGMPKRLATDLNLKESFERSKFFTLSKLADQKDLVFELLVEIAGSNSITDLELKFLTTFFRPRLGDNLNSAGGYGPFPILKNPNLANFTYFFEQRYKDPTADGTETSFSTLENYQYVRKIFLENRVFYAVSDVNDLDLYQAILQKPSKQRQQNFALSFSNIFSCGHYNGLDEDARLRLQEKLKSLFTGKSLAIYGTSAKEAPYEYFSELLD